MTTKKPAPGGVAVFSVRLPSPLYERLRIAAAKTNRTLQEVSETALTSELERSGSGPFDHLTREERRILDAILEMLRTGPADARNLLLAMIKWWRKKR